MGKQILMHPFVETLISIKNELGTKTQQDTDEILTLTSLGVQCEKLHSVQFHICDIQEKKTSRR